MMEYYEIILSWATWAHSYLKLLGTYAYWLIDSICSYLPELHSNWLCSWSDLQLQQSIKNCFVHYILDSIPGFFLCWEKAQIHKMKTLLCHNPIHGSAKMMNLGEREKILLGKELHLAFPHIHLNSFLIGHSTGQNFHDMLSAHSTISTQPGKQ